MLPQTPDFSTFQDAYEQGQSQLVWQWLPADLETPVSTYMKLCTDQDYSFLLESIEGGKTLGRYSAIGFAPDMLWRCTDKQAAIQKDKNDWVNQPDALTGLNDAMDASKIDIVPDGLPPMSSSGLFGMIGYDMVRLIENIPNNNPDMLGIPDALMMRPTIMVIFDNVKQLMCITTPVRPSSHSAKQAYNDAHTRLENIKTSLTKSVPQLTSATKNKPAQAKALTTQADYEDTVRKAIEYINAGDIFQVVPSVRFEMDFNTAPFEFYRSLRRLNPSPFLFHLQLGEFALTGSSPEILVRVRNETVTIRPIAGTRKRGKDDAEDNALAKELLNDTKECAEHLMLLDLGRNDVGRVSEIGSINVTEQFIIEKYSHVMHIVSNVQGKLRKDLKPLDALFSGFPAGTVSGAPKIRAMQIIDELEPYKRGFYAGCIGYFDGHGDVDSCIALRTALHKDGKLYIQAGAGVVADSNPTSEYQECCNKAKALIEAAQLAQSGQISSAA